MVFNGVDSIMELLEDQKREEQIIVCLSSSPSASRVVQVAGSMAQAYGAMLVAIFVETPSFKRATLEERKRLSDNFQLAESYGAQQVVLYGDDSATILAEYANACGATKMVMGMPPSFTGFIPRSTSFVKKIREKCKETDLFIVPERVSYYNLSDIVGTQEKFSKSDALKSFLILLGCTVIGYFFLHSPFSTWNVVMVYILGVLAIATSTTGRSYSLVASLLAVLLYNFFFTEPYFTFRSNPDAFVTFFVMFVVAFIASTLTSRIKEQANLTAQKAYRTDILLETSQKLQKAEDDLRIMDVTAKQLSKLLRCNIIFYPLDEEDNVSAPLVYPFSDEDTMEEYITEEEREVVKWVAKHNKKAGKKTEEFPDAKCEYFAIHTTNNVYAVAGLALAEPMNIDTFEKSLVIAILDECGSSLEKYMLTEKKREMEEKANQETLRSNLLRSISHDLRTPLTSISGNAGMLIDKNIDLPLEKRMEMYNAIYEDSQWLNNLVENLLSITRIDNGALTLDTKIELMDDIINEALQHLDRYASEHHIETKISDDLLFVRCDARLLTQVVINIVNNAIKYTPKDSNITIEADRRDDQVCVRISDDGDGIKDDDKDQIFDMFYTVRKGKGDNRRGLGLGLALCKSIINAHHGIISVEDNTPKGAVFMFTLPLVEVSVRE